MKCTVRNLVFAISLLLATATASDELTRVVGGTDAKLGEFPYQVSLRIRSHFCGGSIINKRWILTAAHCLEGTTGSTITVVVGTNLLTMGEGEEYNVERVFWHEGFNMFDLYNDIGLIKLKTDIEFNENVQPIPLPNNDFNEMVGAKVNLTGWGKTWAMTEKLPTVLQKIQLQVIDNKSCRVRSSFKVNKTQVCTLTRAGEGACNGDSGGPLVANGVQIGVVSFGMPCAKGIPDVFTRVFFFKDWMNKIMSQFN